MQNTSTVTLLGARRAWLVTLFFVAALSGAYAQITASTLGSPIPFTSGSAPRQVAISDIDGDGKPDLVAINSGSNTVSVYRNIGSGTITGASFASKVDFAIGTGPVALAVGDLDADGKPDIAVSVTTSPAISVLKNTSTAGTVSFATTINFGTEAAPRGVAIVDLDTDGKPELVTVSSTANTIAIHKNNTSVGTINNVSFNSYTTFTANASPESIAVGDFDSDSKPDFVVSHTGGASLAVMRNTFTSGTFSLAKTNVTVGVASSGNVIVSDLDGDTKPDIALASGTDKTVHVFWNTTFGSFPAFDPLVTFTTNVNNIQCVAAADLDADGKRDLILGSLSGKVVAFRNENTSSGYIDATSFPTAVEFSAGTATNYGLAVEDLNADSKLDVLASDNAGGTVFVMQNGGAVLTAQTITFAALPAKTMGDVDFDPGATASSGLTVSYSSDNTAVATIVSGKIHLVGAGTATITASQVGNGTYSAAPEKTQVLTVSKQNQTITFAALPAKTIGDTDFDPGATASSGLVVTYASDNTAVATIVSGKIHIVGIAGTATITASQAGNGTYNAASDKTQLLTVKQNQTITFAALPAKNVGDANFDPGATASSGLTVTYASDNTAVATIVSGNIHIVGAGTATITASQAGDGTYNAAPDKTQLLTVSKQNQTITFSALPAKVVGDVDFDPGATASSGLTVSYSSDNTAVATIVSGKIHIVAAGTATITASQAGNSTYNAAPDKTQALTVSAAKINQTITFTALPAKAMGDADFDPGATASSGLTVSYSSDNTSVATIVSGQIHIVGVGSATITASQAGNSTYNAAPDKTQALTVGKQNQTITFNTLPAKIVGEADFDPGATASSGLTVTYASDNTAVATIVSGKIHIVAAGTATITASQAGNGTYNAAPDKTQLLTVTATKINQTITFTALPAKAMGDADFDPGATASSGLTVSYSSDNTSVATIVSGQIHIVGVGSATITASQAGNAAYNAAPDKTQALTVSKQNQTITFNALSAKTVGDADFDPGATASSGLTVSYSSDNTSVATIVSGKIHIIAAGTATITASQAGSSTVNAAPDKTQVLTVNAAAKQNQTITFNGLPVKGLGTPDFDPGATASSGLAVTYSSDNTAVATIVAGKVHMVSTGTAVITASQAGNATYNVAPDKTQTLTVRQSQTVTFSALPVKNVGDADFNPGATASSGLAMSYSSGNTAVATITAGGQIHIVGSGQAIITAFQVGNATFAPSNSVNQVLSVLGTGGQLLDQTITFNELLPVVIGKAPFILPATSSSGLAVTFTSSNPAVATISGSAVIIVAVGETQITASQAGNTIFKAATPVTRTLVVQSIVGTEYEAPGLVSIYPNPTADRLTISASRFNQQSPIQVALVDTYGRVVMQEALRANSDKTVDLSISSVSEGVYILQVRQGALEIRNRIVKIR
jgi:exosome complex RNA-binding protein Rrp42 (RNase PH superfamily)